jgi:phospholipase/carboxylesterase
MANTFRSGIHHVTLMTRHVQQNVDFYAGFLGLRLVKQSGGAEDGEQLHIFYGDRIGSPGSIVSFLVWENGAPGRIGNGQVIEIAFAVAQDALGEWMTRAIRAGVKFEGPSREFGEPVLRLKDPDGVIVKLVASDLRAVAPWQDDPAAVQRLRSVTILTDTPDETAGFVKRFGFSEGPREGSALRLFSDTDAIDVRDGTGFVPGAQGTGVADHVAFRAADVAAVRRMEAELSRLNSSPTNFHDRKYFTSLYVREPGGTLLELATDGPGFTIDEPAERLGETLFLPDRDKVREQDLKIMLPQFSRPGEARVAQRDLPFVHRLHQPEQPDGHTLVLLHGTGGNETDLLPLGHRIAPRATLVGVRGRANEEGIARWFRRFTATTFDQADIRKEAEAFAAFLDGAVSAYQLDPGRMTFVGFSNGANFIGAVMGLYPERISRAVLFRPMQVLETLPKADLAGTHVLALAGAHDPFGFGAPPLEKWLRASGAEVESRIIQAGHELTMDDIKIAKAWLDNLGPA